MLVSAPKRSVRLQEATKFSVTWKGRMYNILGYAFSAYCLYRMTMSTINIVFDRDPTKDPVTRSFEVRVLYRPECVRFPPLCCAGRLR
jgi:hypothetical protein